MTSGAMWVMVPCRVGAYVHVYVHVHVYVYVYVQVHGDVHGYVYVYALVSGVRCVSLHMTRMQVLMHHVSYIRAWQRSMICEAMLVRMMLCRMWVGAQHTIAFMQSYATQVWHAVTMHHMQRRCEVHHFSSMSKPNLILLSL